MKQAYLIAAYNNFEHLEALIHSLDCQEAYLYVNIDAKVQIPGYIQNIKTVNPIVILHEHRVEWGDQSQVIKELELFSKAFENTDIEWFHLISGTDFPLKKIDEINRFYEQAKDVDCFMEIVPIPRHLAARMELYHFYVRRPTRHKTVLTFLLDKFLAFQCKIGIKRKHPDNRPFMYGSNWVDLRRRAVETLLEKRSEIIKYTKFTSNADESYKQTFLQNCGLRIVNDNLRYIDWSARRPSPKSLLLEDYQNIIDSNKLFARKFDSPESPALRQLIVDHLSDPPALRYSKGVLEYDKNTLTL